MPEHGGGGGGGGGALYGWHGGCVSLGAVQAKAASAIDDLCELGYQALLGRNKPTRITSLGNFFFFTFFFLFCKNIWSVKILQNYTSDAVGTAAGTTAVGHGGRGPIPFQKFVIFCLNSDGGKLYMNIVAFDQIYNFVVQSFFI
jgi:hypothetical protein